MSDTSSMIWNRILERQAFGNLFAELARNGAMDILTDLHTLLESTRIRDIHIFSPTRPGQRATRGDIESCRVAVLQEMMNLKACMEEYSSPIAEYSRQEIEMRRAAPELVDKFFNGFAKGLEDVFEKKRQALNKSVDNEVRWWKSGTDTGRQVTRQFLGAGALVAEKMSRLTGGRAAKTLTDASDKAHDVQNKINAEALLSQIWNRHMMDESEVVNYLLSQLLEQYDRAWRLLAPYREVCDDADFGLRDVNAHKNAQPEGVENPAGRVGQAGAAATAAATVSLSLGWHTFSYAMLHVFPPAALVSLVAMAAFGQSREKSYKEQVKDQFSRCLQMHRQDYIRFWFDGTDANKKRQDSLRTGLLQDSNRRVETALISWRRKLFASADVTVYQEILAAIKQHLAWLKKALEWLENELAVLSRERPGYSRMREKIGLRYPGLDSISADMLATGESLLQMHAEHSFPECSPMALPFSKVLERELHRVFGGQYARCQQNPEKKNEFLLGPFIGYIADGKIRGHWSAAFIENLRAANQVRRSLAHRTPVDFAKAKKIRELVIGEQNLLAEIRAM